MSKFKAKLPHIKAFAFDVDGVLARPQVLLSPEGSLMRTMNTKDGFILKYTQQKGIPVAIITGGREESIRKRFSGLGITDIYLSAVNKKEHFADFLYKYALKAGDVLYMGDDLPDLGVMQEAGIAACPADAVTEIKEVADFISPYNGGDACVRDIIEQVLKARGLYIPKQDIEL